MREFESGVGAYESATISYMTPMADRCFSMRPGQILRQMPIGLVRNSIDEESGLVSSAETSGSLRLNRGQYE